MIGYLKLFQIFFIWMNCKLCENLSRGVGVITIQNQRFNQILNVNDQQLTNQINTHLMPLLSSLDFDFDFNIKQLRT